MKTLNLSLIISISLLIPSCSKPVRVWLLNNAPYEVTVVTAREEFIIEAGKCWIVTGVEYGPFMIESEFGRFSYKADGIPSLHIHNVGWGPFFKRMVYVQLEADGKVWVLTEKSEVPVTEFFKQPDGFPLEPNT